MSQSNDESSGTLKPDFSPEVMENLFYWARDRVANKVANTPPPDATLLGDLARIPVLGVFVSFKKNGRLRSCMGYMLDGVDLFTALESAAISASTSDPRFPPISSSEFYDLDLEVWTLGSMRLIDEPGAARRDAIEIGRDGLQIQGRGRRGLLLPSVALEMNWGVDQFLEGVCDKAGLSRGSWADKDVQLFAFEGVSFKKPFVWNVSKNPALAKLIADFQENASNDSSGNHQDRIRPVFSLSPNLFQWQAPKESRRRDSSLDFSESVRFPAVEGMFYPKTAAEQTALLDRFDSYNRSDLPFFGEKQSVSAALVPHAGWVFSGRLASKTLSRIKEPETLVVLAPKHRREGANYAVMPYGYWGWDGGRVPNDLDFCEEFVKAVPCFRKDAVAHRSEHSIEVQIPLVARYFPNAKVVGLLIGGSTREELLRTAEQFAKFLIEWESRGHSKPLLLISSDMNHYSNDSTTRDLDKKATDALESTSPDNLLDVVARYGITMCGVLPAFLTLTVLKLRGEYNRAIKVGYATSCDVSGDAERVVGYSGYLFE